MPTITLAAKAPSKLKKREFTTAAVTAVETCPLSAVAVGVV